MRIVRYFFVGAVAASVDIGIFGTLTKIFHFPWFPVAILSFILATLVNYILSIHHVFSSGVRFAKHHEALLVFAVSAAGLGINQAVLWVLIENFSWDVLLAKFAATGMVFFWNYGLRKNFVFKQLN